MLAESRRSLAAQGRVRVIARILAHLAARGPARSGEGTPPAVRGPPATGVEVG